MAVPARSPRRILRVFISSTDIDLHEYRTTLIDAIMRMGELPVDMRHFGAKGVGTAATESVATVDAADIVVLLVAWRYGTIGTGETKAYTHLEFDEAVRLNKPLFVYLADPATADTDPENPLAHLFPPASRSTGDDAQRLHAFRAEVAQHGRVVDTFTTPDNLAYKLTTALHRYLHDAPLAQRPWRFPAPVSGFVGREGDLVQYDAMLRQGQSVAMVGMGGVGKSTLAIAIVHQLAADAKLFTGGIVWLSLYGQHGVTGLAQCYDQIITAWGGQLDPATLGLATTPDAIAALYEQAVARQVQPAGPALLVWDNVESDFPLRRALEHCHMQGMVVLVTTRTIVAVPSLTVRRVDVLV